MLFRGMSATTLFDLPKTSGPPRIIGPRNEMRSELDALKGALGVRQYETMWHHFWVFQASVHYWTGRRRAGVPATTREMSRAARRLRASQPRRNALSVPLTAPLLFAPITVLSSGPSWPTALKRGHGNAICSWRDENSRTTYVGRRDSWRVRRHDLVRSATETGRAIFAICLYTI